MNDSEAWRFTRLDRLGFGWDLAGIWLDLLTQTCLACYPGKRATSLVRDANAPAAGRRTTAG